MSGIETIDKYTVKLTFSADANVFWNGLQYSYNKNKNHYNIQGFRVGKAPRKLIEKQYGSDVFYNDAVDFILPAAYDQAVKEHNLRVVSKPVINVESVSEENGVSYSAVVTVVGDASVDEYYALTYKKYNTEPSDAEIQREIDSDRDKNARIVTVVRPVQKGDIVTVDFDGYADDKPFEGGHAEDYRLVVGERRFIDNFEEQLIGAETGENIFVRVTFPDNYADKNLAGKPAIFDVKIKEIQEKELPDLDDDFAQDVSEFETLDEYREDITKRLRYKKEREAARAKDEQVMAELVSRADIDMPPVMIENRMDEMMANAENELNYQGMSLDGFLKYSGQTSGQLRESYRGAAISTLKTNLALEAVAKKEKLTASEEEVNREIDRLVAAYQWGDAERSKIDPAIVARDLEIKKAYDFVMDHALEIA